MTSVYGVCPWTQPPRYYRLRLSAERRRKLFGSQTGSLESGSDQAGGAVSLAVAAYEAADGDPLRALTLAVGCARLSARGKAHSIVHRGPG